jgi:sulfite reductase alpha subunit-like flavoprotein
MAAKTKNKTKAKTELHAAPKTTNLIKEIEKLWPQTQKQLQNVNKDVMKLMQKSEKNLVGLYNSAKKKTEELIFKAKIEELYYELGKKVTPLLTEEQSKNKSIAKICSELSDLKKKLTPEG